MKENATITSQLSYANKIKCSHAIIIGEDEIRNKTVLLKNLINSTQKEIKIDNIIHEIKTF